MKGFLNKVQRRVSGSGPSTGTESKNGEKPSTPIATAKAGARTNGIEPTPKADVTLPRRERRCVVWALIYRMWRYICRRSSFMRAQKMQVLKDLALLSDTPMQKREVYYILCRCYSRWYYIFQALFKQKLQLCGVIFNFDDAESDTRGKELKRETLLELAEYVNSPVGQKIFTESLMPDVVEMVRTNLFRTLPPQTDDFDPEEDEPSMEAAWPHLQVIIYHFVWLIPECTMKLGVFSFRFP